MRQVFLLGLFLATTLFSFAQEKTAQQTEKETKKNEQHIKVLINQDGKQTRIDTTFNLADDKMIQFKVDSLMQKLGVNDGKAGGANIVILRGGKKVRVNGHHMDGKPGEGQFDLLYEQGDSGKVKSIKKVIRIRNGEKLETIVSDDDMVPPMPPMPPVPPFHMNSFKMSGGDPFAMDPDNKDIISYDKKDIGKGLEKIIIVRKKHTPESDAKEVQLKVEVDDQKKE